MPAGEHGAVADAEDAGEAGRRDGRGDFFDGFAWFRVPAPQVPSSPAWTQTPTAFERTDLGAVAFSATDPVCERTRETLPAASVVPLPGTCVTVAACRVPIAAPAIGSPV